MFVNVFEIDIEVNDAEALLKRKFGESNAEGACDTSYQSRAMFANKFKDCVNNGLAHPRTIMVG